MGDRASDDRFVRASGVLWRQSADVVLARTISDPGIIEVGGTGVLLWLALVEPLTAEQLASELAEVTGAQIEIVAPDVRAALRELEQRNLVTCLEAVR